MKTILKRLEILKAAIALEDDEEINDQNEKLNKLITSDAAPEIVAGLKNIIESVQQKRYSNALQSINDFLSQWNSLVVWEDPVVPALQFEIQGLLQQLNDLQDELADVTHTIHTFEQRHTQELGSVILQLLALRKKAAEDKVKKQPDNTTARQQFEEAAKEESDYSDTFEETKHTILHDLSDDEAAELKTKYRKISRLTHPDVVDKQFEKEAAALFIKAQEALERNDLATIRELLDYLESGQPFTLRHQSITAAEELQKEAAPLAFPYRGFAKAAFLSTRKRYL